MSSSSSAAAATAAPAKPPITCHILDTTIGRPATGVRCTLLQFSADAPTVESTARVVATGTTDADGRVASWSGGVDAGELVLKQGAAYKIRFEVEEYFARMGQETFFPFVEVAFRVRGVDEHYHVPLLLAGWGYSTYRGS
ncbi:hypothetical protein FN846DRAFT_778362 [Sphaerosporella brunnea]|uniref:5-hydroxyisourate hydrolase n=1 Tax=Sphaerosporella brunnea TaxID=1250544 RepID=A0A5J5EXF5_9PEZI|nr:hypothetical protein FN846DRAFT_778362 [Sphaerosporella brunnea]